ncbi:MAG: hypothetical protein K2Y08_03090 [Alphaproteobacteria bacterium]|nr:hypothetical protein [Alphaproteobacteria bacterium]
MQFQFSREMTQQRKARVHTLIQLGGLLVRSGVTAKLGIEIGGDLQKDEHQKKKAYTLLGMFRTQLSVPNEAKKTEEIESLGKQFLFGKERDEKRVNVE